VRLALDGTPLLGRPTGVGRYVSGLLSGLVALPDPPEIRLTAFSWRGTNPPAPPGSEWHYRRFPARVLQATWERSMFPPVEWLTGRIDVFHATNFVLPPTHKAAGVVSVHDLSYDQHADTVDANVLRYRKLVPRGLRHAKVVLTLTEATAVEVRERYGHERVMVARPGVDPRWFEPQVAPEGLPSEYVLFVGSIEPRKNLPVLVEALRRLPDAPPLVLAGPAGWGAELDTSGIETIRTGYLEDDELRRVVASASVLAFPSRHEGFGLPPLEAFATGVPAVVSDLPVLREVLGDQAAYVPVGDVEALADGLRRALEAPGDGESRRTHARAWTWERCAAEALAAYQAALLH
jgi:glycosyltransferase involved in cell wall biosynthesis